LRAAAWRRRRRRRRRSVQKNNTSKGGDMIHFSMQTSNGSTPETLCSSC
jgi:hypothetical protein